MAIGPATVWRVRTGGSNVNGAGYDATISGAGTDYSQQDGAQLSLTDITCPGTTLIGSVTGGFTSAMIGNAIWLTGGGATAGAYFVVGFTSSNAVTLDRSPGTVAAGSGKVGGAWADPWTNVAVSGTAQTVAGNKIFVRGSGSSTPATNDYVRSGFINVFGGDIVNGNITFVGENGYPRIASNGLMFFNSFFLKFEQIYFSTTGTNYSSFGILNTANANPSGCIYAVNCKFDQAAFDMGCASGAVQMIGCEVFSSVAPGSPGSSYACNGTAFGMQVYATNVHDTVGHGVSMDNRLGNHVTNSIIAKCGGDGYTVTNNDQGTDAGSTGLIGTTIDDNLGNAIVITGTTGLEELMAYNNIISNHTSAGKVGILVASGGSTATNDAIKGFIDFNTFFGNTTDLSGISHGPNDLVGVDPQYAAQSTEGYDVGLNMKAAGYPKVPFPQSLIGMTATQSYVDMGGVQRMEGAP